MMNDGNSVRFKRRPSREPGEVGDAPLPDCSHVLARVGDAVTLYPDVEVGEGRPISIHAEVIALTGEQLVVRSLNEFYPFPVIGGRLIQQGQGFEIDTSAVFFVERR